MAQVTTISEYLKGVSQLLTDDGLRYVLSKRRLNGDEVLPQFEGETWTDEQGNVHEYTALTERDQDLAEGTAYYWLSNLPVGGATEKVSDGGWSHSEGGWTVSKANIDEWMRKYRSLFQKWDEELLDRSRIRIINF
jgi:hypothetical protein